MSDSIQRWTKQINWSKRVKAVCKPCWEIKYCPYGPLVESFPAPEKPTDKTCRIYGHDCPVFSVAEPFTETKELRRIDRRISRPVQFRVLKRENQICQSCGKPIRVEEIEFDHRIPFSKGGSSDEHNVVLLCRQCNRKKRARFEDTYLVRGVSEHLRKPDNPDLITFLKKSLQFYHEFRQEHKRIPTADDYTVFVGNKKPDIIENSLVDITASMRLFLTGTKPEEIPKRMFTALRTRWGFSDGRVHKLADVAQTSNVFLDELIRFEGEIVWRLGWNLPLTPENLKKWQRL